MKIYHGVKTIDLTPASKIGEALNQFKWEAVKTLPDGAVIFGGDDSEARRNEIRERLRKYAGNNAAAMIGPYQPSGGSAENRSALFVSCISHAPRFPVGFTPKKSVFSFSSGQGVPVQGFGSEGTHAASLGDALDILADDLKGTFILRLPFYGEPKSKPCFITLAKIPAMTCLEDGLSRVREALKSPLPTDQAIKQNDKWWRYHHHLSVVDKFWAPKLKVTLSCDYGELIGKTYWIKSNSLQSGPWMIREAQQLLSFRLDEQGAMTQAVFQIAPDFLSSEDKTPPKPESLPFLPRMFSFNGPFLAALWIKDAEWPYLACWADSEEVLLKK